MSIQQQQPQNSMDSPFLVSSPSSLNVAALFSDLYAQLEVLLLKKLCETKKIPFELPKKSQISRNLFERVSYLLPIVIIYFIILFSPVGKIIDVK
jgi:hypothetical protein